MEVHSEEIRKPKTKLTSLFYNIKFFVLCQSLLQLSQLLYSSYFKSCVTTLEKRYGLNSYTSGTISSLHEVGNTILIVFVSYFGSRAHRPRLIGLGGVLMSVSATLLALPHFLSQRYQYHSALLGGSNHLCTTQGNSSLSAQCGQQDYKHLQDNSNMWIIMASAQLLFGIGSVPIQPFGISFVDDFAGPLNGPLYVAILFAVSVFGPAFGYLLGSATLRIYVDVNRMELGKVLELTPRDQRWVGAWWLGLLVSSGCLALTSIPYFFFPRHMAVDGDSWDEDTKPTESSLFTFMKMFPRLFMRLLLSPLFLLLVLSQCCFSSVVAGLSTFLSKFLEHQYSAPASYSSLLIGLVNLPPMAIGMLIGGVIMKRTQLTLKVIPRFSLAVLFISIVLCLPLFILGCPTQRIAGVNTEYRHLGGPGLSSMCYLNCSCSAATFNPVCGSDNTEYISPCHAGCTSFAKDPKNSYKIQTYSNCSCILDEVHPGSAQPGSCANGCTHYLMPAIILTAIAGFIASLSHNPVYMMLLRTVSQDEKSFAIGVQFLLLRLLAWLPAPAIFGKAIDSSCIWWKTVCGNKLGSCGYYDNTLFRHRFLGLQVAFKAMGFFLLCLVGWKVRYMKEYTLTQDGLL